MPPLWVLIHSPLVGPRTWSLVAEELQRRGALTLVPTLLDDDASREPYWRQHADSVAYALTGHAGQQPLVLVAHSGAGALLPAIRERLANPIAAYLFADAVIPQPNATRLDLLRWESPEWAAEFQTRLEQGERFPGWAKEELSDSIPDGALRRAVVAELRPRALPFFTEPIPVFSGWPDAPCAYLQLSPTYAPYAQAAHQRGWPLRHLDAAHFHMLVNPQAVTDSLQRLLLETKNSQGSQNLASQ